MRVSYFRRKLWFTHQGSRHQLGQGDLLIRREPIVVLGEPGMGKTKLLKELSANDGNAFCRAQQLINRSRPKTLLGDSKRIVIDAIDEVSAKSNGDAVDLVLQKLGELDYPPFILSCRVSEWRAAVSTQAISDQYDGATPLEVHLEPLDEDEQYELLTRLTGNALRAQTLIEHFKRFGLDFLGNPQTLELVAALSVDRSLPATSGALFEDAIETLRKEYNHSKQDQELPRESMLDAAGAAFSALILSGNARIVDKPSGAVDLTDKALPLSEVEAFDSGHVRQAANTKLFATDMDGLTYAHRRIGEFVGARWLSIRADTRAKRKRLLEKFKSRGLVPASLRGIHAWLARDPQLADAVIEADPMGIIEYGDAEALDPNQARLLFAALERLAATNPRFIGWQEYHAAALVTPPLMARVTRVIEDRGAEFGLRLFLLQQLKGAPTAEGQRTLLRERMLDEAELYGIRHESAQVLISIGGENWSELLEALRQQVSENALRLACELLDDIGLEFISDEQIVAVIFAYVGLSICSLEARSEHKTVLGVFYPFTKAIPVERLNGLLDQFTAQANFLLPETTNIETDELVDLQYTLVLKRLNDGGEIEPLRLWQWLEPFDKKISYHGDHGKDIGEWLKANPSVREAIQRYVLIDKANNKNIWQRAWPLHHSSFNLYPTQAEIVSLLQILDPNDRTDERWRELINLGQTWGEEGEILRDAAKCFAHHRSDLLAWIDGLAERQIPAWEIRREKQKRERQAKQASRFAKHRRDFLVNLEEVKSGNINWVHQPAQAYLKRFSDIGDSVPAHKRVSEWLGEEVALAAHDGFEAFFRARPLRPSAKTISLSYAGGKRWAAGDIIVAALAERTRKLAKPFEGVSSERLAAGLFVCWREHISTHAGLTELTPQIEAELKRRGRWTQVVRIYIQPQLRQQKQHIDRLGKFMHDGDNDFSAHLAENWLSQYPEMSNEAEVEMIDCLLRSNRHRVLKELFANRMKLEISDERKRNWHAVSLIVDFDEAHLRLNSIIEPELIWHIRDRTGDNQHREKVAIPLSINQLSWFITTFRRRWPEADQPRGATIGDINPYDASRYIQKLISRLGNNVSTEAVTALSALKDAPEDTYTWTLRVVSAEQLQKYANEIYTPPTLNQIKMVLDGGSPGSVADLRAIIADELQELGSRLRGSSEDEVNLYWTDSGQPRTENECRDRTVSLLRGHLDPLSIYQANEADMPQNKRADIVFYHGGHLLPLEAKRQQHRDLWNAIDEQLEAFYTGHWQAEGQGLFLVFWFGSNYQIPAPPDGAAKPTNAIELQKKLDQHSAVKEGRVEVVVLDLSR